MPAPSILAVIPARFQSTRLPGKPLVQIGGQTMIERVWRQVRQAQLVHHVLIATDDPRILRTAQAFGAEAMLTRADHVSGTDRVAEAAAQSAADIVVNVQGDEPFLAPEAIDEAIRPMLAPQCKAPMATLRTPIRTPEDAANPNVVKVVVDRGGHALYFSRHPIPFVRDVEDVASLTLWYRHLGVYVYERGFLLGYGRMPRGPLEAAENLEQLRALENGHAILVADTKYEGMGIDTEEDLAKARKKVGDTTNG